MSELALRTGENEQVLIPLRFQQTPKAFKLTRAKLEKFLQFYIETPNFTKACAHIKVSRFAIHYALDNNPDFKNAFEQVKEALNDNVRETIITMSLQPSREGYNDRKLYAEANLPEYKRNAEIQVNVQVNSLQASGELANFVHRLPSEK